MPGIRPPIARRGLIERPGILGKLRTFEQPVVSIVAPAGYGKTTAMAQFHEARAPSSAWLTLDEAHNDPVVLLTDLTAVLQEAGLAAPNRGTHFQSDSALTRGIRALEDELVPGKRGTLFLDQVDHVQSQRSLDIVGAVVTRIAGPVQVVVASRTGEGLPLGLLRSQGLLGEVGLSDLTMDESEAAEVFATMGAEADVDVGRVVETTEGWPVGVYLMALAIETGAIGPGAVDVGGDDVFFADYLRDELMKEARPEMKAFLLESSLLPRMSGPLCDFALETSDSHRMLADLEKANLLVVPLDRTRTWFRYHSLMKDYLSADIARSGPAERIATIHSRAATWLDDNGFGELAVAHARKAGDSSQFVRLFVKHARTIASQGRLGTVLEWVDWLEEADALGDHGEWAALAAYVRSMDGNPGGAEHMGRYAFYDRDGLPRTDEQLGPLALVVRSMQFKAGPEQALLDARRAIDAIAADSEWLHLGGIAEALALVASEGLEASEPTWMQVLLWGEAIEGPPTVSLALAQRALIAIARGDWAAAQEFADRALVEINRVDVAGYLSSGLVYTVAARCACHHGRLDEARTNLSAASQLRPRMSSAFPAVSVQTLHEMVRAFVEVADLAGARQVMREAADIVAIRPRLGTLTTDHEALKSRLAAMPAGSVGASSLTNAELRLLPMLVTHLTYPEIGERLFVSRHTVKTQAMSIYRKLGVSSRSEAVERARELGFITA